MVIDHHYSHLRVVRSSLSAVVYPLQYIVNLPVDAFEWTSNTLVTRHNLVEENTRLKEQQLLLSSKLQRFAILEAANKRLQELLESSFRLNDRVLVAELLAVDQQVFRRQIVINKGQREGAYDGQPIVDSSGIMGQIIHVGPFSSTVLLITDLTHALPVQINRNGLRAIAVGTGEKDFLQLENLPNNADMKEGYLIISSGLGQRFPPGYPVGVISSISLVPGEPFAKVKVTPSARLEQSREVLMVWPNEHATIKSESPDYAINI